MQRKNPKRRKLWPQYAHTCLGPRPGSGVGFRYSTQREGLKLGLTGYARNMDDGSVEVLACGEAQQVEKLIAWLKAGGPRSAPGR